MDCTMGVCLCYLLLQIIEKFYFEKKGLYQFKTGNYIALITFNNDEPQLENSNVFKQEEIQKNNELAELYKNKNIYQQPIGRFIKIDYLAYTIQLGVWALIVVMSKATLYFFQIIFQSLLEDVGNFIFSGIKTIIWLKLLIVIILVPLVMNSFCFWIQDNFLKKNEITTIEESFGIKQQMYVDEDDVDYQTNENNNINNNNNNNK
eukprot:TRINITY_DN2588_c0_g1_i5.p2 TRINITY_DN2588_c0_g1~~TRINITY_DN2588_c0_g1_i5.p2  ORF type:complete len:205 (+),score=41.88 TRINITY_DN2588_c0_g1_i5:352-966(+)